MRIDLTPLKALSGFHGAAVVDCQTGLILGRIAGGADLEAGAAGATEIVRSARLLAEALAVDGDVEDVIVSMTGHFHMARVVAKNPSILIYAAFDRRGSNLGLAHLTLREVERAVGG